MKSIISDEEKCFLCGQTYGLETHHCIHGSGRRRIADQDGLTVRLCHVCHRNLHDHGFFDRDLQMIAERAWIKYNGGTIESFRARYGKNYLFEG